MRRSAAFLGRMKAPLALSLKWAIGCSIWVTLGFIVTRGANVAAVSMRILPLILWYFAAATIVAVIIAALRDWMHSRLRGAVVGALCAAVLELTIVFAIGLGHARFMAVLFAVAVVTPLGAFLGAIYWTPTTRDRSSEK